MTVGAVFSISVAAALQTFDATVFETHALNCRLLKAAERTEKDSVGWVLEGLPTSKGAQLLPDRNCHWTVGVGDPPVTTLNVAVPPMPALELAGLLTVGAVFALDEFTVSVAGPLHTGVA